MAKKRAALKKKAGDVMKAKGRDRDPWIQGWIDSAIANRDPRLGFGNLDLTVLPAAIRSMPCLERLDQRFSSPAPPHLEETMVSRPEIP